MIFPDSGGPYGLCMTDAIRDNLVKIQEEVDFDEIETFLFSKAVINSEEREILTEEPGNTRKVIYYSEFTFTAYVCLLTCTSSRCTK